MLWSGCWEAEARVLEIVAVCVAIVGGVGGNVSVGVVLEQLLIFLVTRRVWRLALAATRDNLISNMELWWSFDWGARFAIWN